MRMFGHADPIGKDHAGPEARWAKQERRREKTRAKAAAKAAKAAAKAQEAA
ncbi:MAG TPA: hypothetical protein VNH41_04980 [Steroidobacteraceae bacterium]|nr:hypothetical protein [Steroidobacteraceae bacterium]